MNEIGSFNRSLTFDETSILEGHREFLRISLGMEKLVISHDPMENSKKVPEPGNPVVSFQE